MAYLFGFTPAEVDALTVPDFRQLCAYIDSIERAAQQGG